MKRWILAGAGMVALFGATSGLRADDEKSLIVAGERIGQVQLGMDNAKVDLGKPTTSDQAMGHAAETYCSKSADGETQQTTIYIQSTDENRKQWWVEKVLVTSPFFRTSAGLSTRSQPEALWKEFPDLQYANEGQMDGGTPVDFYASVANGIGFVIERNTHPEPGKMWGRCRAVLVFPRGEDAKIGYLKSCQPKP